MPCGWRPGCRPALTSLRRLWGLLPGEQGGLFAWLPWVSHLAVLGSGDKKLCFHPPNGCGLVRKASSDNVPIGCCSRSYEAHVIDGMVSPQNSCSLSLGIWP